MTSYYSSSIESKTHHQIRSLSLPSKFNPLNQTINKELNKLKIKEESSTSASETIIIGLSGVAELYQCINQALSLPLTQQSLSLRKHEKYIRELFKACLRLRDFCKIVRELVQQQQQATQELESSLSKRRPSYSSYISSYNLSRKLVIKNAKGLCLSLKQLLDDNELFVEHDYHLSTVIRTLRCVCIINLSVLESVLLFVSTPVSRPKQSLVMKLVNKGRSKCDSGNELYNVDFALQVLGSERRVEEEKRCMSLRKLKDLVGVIEEIDSTLGSTYKQLTEIKVCLNNILSF